MFVNRSHRGIALTAALVILGTALQSRAAGPVTLEWQVVQEEGCTPSFKSGSSGHIDACYRVLRAEVPGGWLVRTAHQREGFRMETEGNSNGKGLGLGQGMGLAEGLAFVPDPEHTWM